MAFFWTLGWLYNVIFFCQTGSAATSEKAGQIIDVGSNGFQWFPIQMNDFWKSCSVFDDISMTWKWVYQEFGVSIKGVTLNQSIIFCCLGIPPVLISFHKPTFGSSSQFLEHSVTTDCLTLAATTSDPQRPVSWQSETEWWAQCWRAASSERVRKEGETSWRHILKCKYYSIYIHITYDTYILDIVFKLFQCTMYVPISMCCYDMCIYIYTINWTFSVFMYIHTPMYCYDI